MLTNSTAIGTSSDGAWQGDNPFNYAFPLLIIQTVLILFISRFLAFILKPLRQPKVVAEILGGILLGPSALGRNKEYLQLVFPSWSNQILESVASIGLLFFLFLVGLELDLTSIRRSGKKAIVIAVAGISLPFIFGAAVTVFLRKVVDGEDKIGYAQCLLFMGVSLSITAFPVLARILAELKLLTTQMGETAMAAAAFNDVVAWIMLALAVALAGNGNGGAHKSPIISVWVLISGIGFVAFMLLVVRPMMSWVARHGSFPEQDHVDETYICLTLVGVMLSGFMTDLIGIHAIFGAFVFGLTIPKGGEFAGRIIKRIEDFVSGLLLPLYFASSGLKTDVAKIQGVEAWGLLGLVISTACAGKILGTFLVAMLCMIPARESLTLGVLMNTKGLVELIVLNIGKEKKVLNDEMFAILVLMALFTTFMTTPAVIAIYKPLRVSPQKDHRKRSNPTRSTKDQLQVLACIHGPRNLPSLINFVETIRKSEQCPFKLYAMHLTELTHRSSSIMMVQRTRKNGIPFIKRLRQGGVAQDQIATAFKAYSQVGRVKVRLTTSVSALPTMHEDICLLAEEKRASLIILPFHKLWREGEEFVGNTGHGWRLVNQMVLQHAPCPVAILVDRGFGIALGDKTENHQAIPQQVCVIFLGGPDDRKALELTRNIAERSGIKVTLIRFIDKDGSNNCITTGSSADVCTDNSSVNHQQEKELDEAAIAEFMRRQNKSIEYREKIARSLVDEVRMIGQFQEYELIITGRGQSHHGRTAKIEFHQTHYSELGRVGSILASSSNVATSSVLVIKQHDLGKTGNATITKMSHDRGFTGNCIA